MREKPIKIPGKNPAANNRPTDSSIITPSSIMSILGGTTGPMVQEAYEREDYDAIIEYQLLDVLQMDELFLRMTGQREDDDSPAATPQQPTTDEPAEEETPPAPEPQPQSPHLEVEF